MGLIGFDCAFAVKIHTEKTLVEKSSSLNILVRCVHSIVIFKLKVIAFVFKHRVLSLKQYTILYILG